LRGYEHLSPVSAIRPSVIGPSVIGHRPSTIDHRPSAIGRQGSALVHCSVLTRFAPAPTGWLHLGHVLNAEYVWGCGARVVLRIEDHDRQRSRPAYEHGIVEDLEWLGYRSDLVRQSERGAVYLEAAAVLRAQGLVYACDCTRSAIARRQPQPEERAEPAGDLKYDDYCRTRNLPLTGDAAWRVRMDAGVERFLDGLLGPQEQDPSAQIGDVLIRDRLGNWTYQFVASVDDFDQGIDLVIRGTDLLASTGRQIRLARLLGRATPPEFRHHPLIMKTATQKLSKSDRDTGVRDLRAGGWTAEQVRAAARLSLSRTR
jgi:glutamyl-Q tRNA(Asp) synthetase